MKTSYILLIFLIIPFINRAQTLIFAQLNGSPNLNTVGWNLAGASYAGDTGGDADAFPNELILTDPVGSTSGAIFYSQPIDLATCYEWNVQFDFRMDDGTSADGIAFCFLDVPPTGYVSGGGVGIPSTANGVKVVFDSYDNGCGMNPEIQIMNGIGYNECDPNIIRINNTSAGDLDFITDATYKTAVINYSYGTLTVNVNGQTYLTGNYNLNFVGYLGFTASTGGSNDRHSIRNVIVYADVATSNAGPDVTICSGESVQIGSVDNVNYLYDWGNDPSLSNSSISNPSVTLTNSGSSPISQTFTVTTTLAANPNSCPSQDNVIVTVLPTTSSNVNASICQGSNYQIGGQSFNTSGVHQTTVQGSNGCDSLITLNLTVNPALNSTLNTSICEGATFPFGGQNISISGQYLDTLQTISGCDSILTLNLVVNPILSSTQNTTICQGESISFFGQTLSSSGLYSQTLQTLNGCDSIVNLNLLINQLPNTPTITSNSPVICPNDIVNLTATSNVNSQFVWSGPQNFNSNDASVSFTVQLDDVGDYQVYAILNGCQSAVATTPVSILNVYDFDDYEFPNVITANEDGINDSLDINGNYKTCQEYTLLIFNRWGEVVYEQNLQSSAFKGLSSDGKVLLDGIYFYRLNYGDKIKNGFIHLIR